MQAWKRTTLSTAVLLALAAHAAGQEAVQWKGDLEQAKREAAQTNRLVLIHFWAPWCKPCMRLNSEVFSEAGVAAVLEKHYVPVKLDADRHVETARTFGVDSLPTTVILSPAGQVITTFNPPQTSTAYITHMNDVAAANLSGQAFLQAKQQPTAGPMTSNPYVGPAPSGTRPAPARPGQAANDYRGLAYDTTLERQDAAAPPPGGTRYAIDSQTNVDTNHRANYTAPPLTPPDGNRYAQAPPQGPSAGPGFQGNTPGFDNRYGENTVGATGASQASMSSPANYSPPDMALPPQLGPPPMVQAHQEPLVAYQPPQMQAGGFQPSQPPQMQPPQMQRPQVQSPQMQPPTGNSGIALDGFCPVTLVQGRRWKNGDARWGAIHHGRTYLFAGETEQRQFLSNPELYSPALSGDDPVLAIETQQSIAGHRRHGVYYRDRVYLFSGEETLNRFSQDPERYAGAVRQMTQMPARQEMMR